MIRTLIICMTALTLNAAVLTDPWSVDLRKHGAVDRTYKQGETIDMRVTVQAGFTAYDLTGARAVFYWFTNSVGNVWWTNAVSIAAPKTGVLSVRWTPAMDVGALAYPYWIGIWPSGSTSPVWRLTGTIKLLTSPGFVPNSLVPPVRTLDFGSVSVTNAPWVDADLWKSNSEALASALSSHSENTNNPHGVTAAQTGALTAEADAAALRMYHYGAPDIVETPDAVREDSPGVVYFYAGSVSNIVVPYVFNGSTVTQIVWKSDYSQFKRNVKSVVVPKSVTSIGHGWMFVSSTGVVESITFNGTVAFGNSAFYGCPLLTNVTFKGDAGTLGVNPYYGSSNVINYVINPLAQGWSNSYGGRPVVRPALYGDGSKLTGITAGTDPAAVTNIANAVKELHADSFTNLIWRKVWSNGWEMNIAYTNTP